MIETECEFCEGVGSTLGRHCVTCDGTGLVIVDTRALYLTRDLLWWGGWYPSEQKRDPCRLAVV